MKKSGAPGNIQTRFLGDYPGRRFLFMKDALETVDDLIDLHVTRHGCRPQFLFLPEDLFARAVAELSKVKSLVNMNGIIYLHPTYRRVVLVKRRELVP